MSNTANVESAFVANAFEIIYVKSFAPFHCVDSNKAFHFMRFRHQTTVHRREKHNFIIIMRIYYIIDAHRRFSAEENFPTSKRMRDENVWLRLFE